MIFFDWIKGLVYGLATLLGGVIHGWRLKRSQDLKEGIKAHEKRQSVEDGIRKSDFNARRLRLKRWSVRGVEGDPPDGRGR